MPHVKVYIHFVWSTKYREPFLKSSLIRKKVWKHIKENAAEKGIDMDFINGYYDHCHCLVRLQPDQTISELMQLIKGESSFWINKNKLYKDNFEWQNDYYAVSVGESALQRVRTYIKNQEFHHQFQSFEQEEEVMIEKYGFIKIVPPLKTEGK
ncbi:IS200/IS605 family transposase [Labilibaculum antarcticum]|uniref:Transposase n=1 Tax=Labilibaculum antarcticum TaxID=1717717 RepID=A0A1Y1CI34_9BACT|nr:IS200/IS605 family transposase [Labilibaculum antarcticum]BAX79743.1 transposase [Labilibaculum antarcticum]